ncbi:hypothetical protein M2146_002707 [Lachnospiraceae bacterium PF1-22]
MKKYNGQLRDEQYIVPQIDSRIKLFLDPL